MHVPLVSVAKVELTRACNHACSYCYNYVRDPDEEKGLPKEQKRRNLDVILDEIDQNNIGTVIFTGGEPAIVRDLLLQGVRGARQRGIRSGLNTNLTVMKDGDVAQLAEEGLGSMLVSFPSYNRAVFNAITNGSSKSYDRFLENLRRAREAELFCTVNMVVTTENAGQVYETGKFLHERFGVTEFTATPVSPTVTDHVRIVVSAADILRTFDDLNALKKDFGMRVSTLKPVPLCLFPEHEPYMDFLQVCGAGLSEVYISINGDVSPCGSLASLHGNVLKDGLQACIENCATAYGGRAVVPKECEPCAEVDTCRGACRAEAETTCGSVSGPSYYFVKPLEHKVLPVINTSNFYDGKVVFDTASEIKRVEVSDGDARFEFSGFGESKVMSEQETNLLIMLHQAQAEGRTLGEVTKQYRLQPSFVNQFLNHLQGVGVIKYEQNNHTSTRLRVIQGEQYERRAAT